MLICFVLLGSGIPAAVVGQGDAECGDDDVDQAELAEAGIMSIDALMEEGITRFELFSYIYMY